MASILSKIKSKQKDFSNRNLAQDGVNPVFAPSQDGVINLIDKYWQSRFKTDDFDSKGQKKPFFNVIETPVFIAGKQIDIDTKGVKVIPESGQNVQGAFFFEKELSRWMKQTKISKLLNEVKWRLPKYGSVVLKKIEDEDGNVDFRFVPLQNLHMDARATSLQNSHFVMEEFELLPRQLKQNPGLDQTKVKKAIRKSDDLTITVFEFFGDIDKNDNFFVVADVGEGGIILQQGNMDSPPYYELHWDKIPGRWLGVGVVEKNFEAQIHLNRVQYLKANGLHWTSKHIYQTQDDNVEKNLMVDVDDGQILRNRRPINPVANEERNLAAYREEENVWLNHVDRRNFSTDVMRGVLPKSGTPLGSVSLAAQQARTFFEQKREEFGLFMKDLLWDEVIPQFKEQNSSEHVMNMFGESPEDTKRFDELSRKQDMKTRFMNYVTENGSIPTVDDLQMFDSLERREQENADERRAELPESVYDDLEFKIELVITGESQNLQSKLNALTTALQTTQDPAESRQLRNKLLQLIGEEPVPSDPQFSSTDVAQQMAQKQGSKPRIRQPNTPQGTAQTQTNI